MNTTTPKVDIRRADQRGRTRIGWLDSAHSFSFGQYFDPQRVGYRSLRVINDDRVAPGAGFGEHGHDNMEIITWVLEGSLKHGDSLENSRTLTHGEVQVMSAGSGIHHREFNGSDTDESHFIQIWITPKGRDIQPRYDQRTIGNQARHNRLAPIASGFEAHQADGALPIHQDAAVFVADIDAGTAVTHTIVEGRAAYVHVATGTVELAGQTLSAGDAAVLERHGAVAVKGVDEAQVLLFDLA